MTDVIPVCARSIVVPRRRRMKPSWPWLTSVEGVRCATQMSAPCGISKLRGATPDTVELNSAKRIDFPTTAGSLLYSAFHNRVEITTVGSGPCCGGALGGGG